MIEQVWNLQSAIKVACDFVSLENLDRTIGLLVDQRHYRIQMRDLDKDKVASGPADILQIHTLLWYAWLSVSAYTDPTVSLRSLCQTPSQPEPVHDSECVVLIIRSKLITVLRKDRPSIRRPLLRPFPMTYSTMTQPWP